MSVRLAQMLERLHAASDICVGFPSHLYLLPLSRLSPRLATDGVLADGAATWNLSNTILAAPPGTASQTAMMYAACMSIAMISIRASSSA